MTMQAILIAVALAAGGDVERILERYEKARPSEQELSFYSLDWAADLGEARSRASREGRPVFFIVVTNISGPTDFFTGHC
jgi:hypothetical protein